jgi:PAS domain S-box-containing protein
MRDRTPLAVLSAFTLTVCLLLLSTWACVRVLSGVRAYVGGEGLYSKSQKNAVYFLASYAHTRDESWFRRFDHALRVPEGDRDARMALDRGEPDLNAARRGFIQGGNSPDDVDDLIFVFRRMRHMPYVSAAVSIWQEADGQIAALRQVGETIHSRSGNTTTQPAADLDRIETLNTRLTTLEDQFSSTLGAGARFTAFTLLSAIAGLAVLLWLTGVLTLRRLLSALGSERETLRATIDNAPLGIVLVNAPDGKVRIGNSHAWELLGSPATNYLKSDQGGGMDSPVAQALAGASVRGQDMEWTRPDGTSLWLRVGAAPIRRGGEIDGAVVTFYDISEERKYEEALVRQSERLARSNADLEQFAYTTSHDLQEPLRNIGLFSQLLARRYADLLDSEAGRLMDTIESSVERMNALIRDLLAFSRVDNLNAAPMNAVNLNLAVEWACSNLSARVEESRAAIEFEGLPVVRGDEVQIVQVFQNLIDNAIKYRSAAAPHITIYTEPAGALFRIFVRDNGVGIEPQFQQQIFGIFKRLHGRDVPGTGIGLALVKRVVERHGGRIHVESAGGHGATFVFTLPGVVEDRDIRSSQNADVLTAR